MTVNQYIQLSDKPGSTVSKAKLKVEFSNNKSKYTVFTFNYKSLNRYIYLVDIPSRQTDVVYNVIIELDGSKLKQSEVSVKSCKARFFSNSPSFIYTYGHLFWQKGLLCNWVRNKLSDQVLSDKAIRTNPNEKIYIERSLYLACLMLFNGPYMTTEYLNTNARVITGYEGMTDHVTSQYHIEEDHRNSKKEQRDARANAARVHTKEETVSKETSKKYPSKTAIKKIKTVKTASKGNTANTVRTISSSKSVRKMSGLRDKIK